MPQTVWVSWSWSLRQVDFSSSCSRIWGQDAVVRASARQRAWALRAPVEQLSRMRKKCCYNTEELGANIWQSVPVSNSLLTYKKHQPFRNPFENKVWEVYFSKEVCSFVIIVDYGSVCICICIVVSWLHNTSFHCKSYWILKKELPNQPALTSMCRGS